MAETNKINAELLDIRDDSVILEEVKYITSLIIPGFDFHHIHQAFNDIKKLFRGQYPGFRKCNTHYHDMRHTLTVFLAMTRLIHGAHVAGFKLSEQEINVGIIGALMHDTGYIQLNDDDTGTGGKYTLVHIGRSIKFVQEYYKDDRYFQERLDDFAHILSCTGVSIEIEKITFNSNNMEIIGKMLGTADLLAQMADRFYLEKLVHLFFEFEEAGVPGFDSELDLLRKTINFYHMTKTRYEKNFSNVNRYMVDHFKIRWNLEKNIYSEAIERNINYLKYVLESNQQNIHACFRRNFLQCSN
jgi:hypothetical protein